MNSVPNEVELHILDFLMLDSTTLSKVSQQWRRAVVNNPFWCGRARLHNIIGMMLEDKKSKPSDKTGFLGKQWENYHKCSWPSQDRRQTVQPRWKVGDYVDAKDKINVWGPAIIADKTIELVVSVDRGPHSRDMFRVQFLGWSRCFDEWVPADRLRPIGDKSVNPRNKFETLRQGHRFWGLFRRDGGPWSMDSLIVSDISDNVKSVGNGFQFAFVSKHNVDDYVIAATDGTTYLTLGDRGYHPVGRKLAM